MSNVEQGIMNVEVRMFLLDCFGANNAHKWNLNRFPFLHYSTFPVRHSTLNQYVQWLKSNFSISLDNSHWIVATYDLPGLIEKLR